MVVRDLGAEKESWASAIGRGAAGAAAMIGVVLSLLLFLFVREQVDRQTDDQLAARTARATEAVQRRLAAVEHATRATAALFDTSDDVTALAFGTFVDRVVRFENAAEQVLWIAPGPGGAPVLRYRFTEGAGASVVEAPVEDGPLGPLVPLLEAAEGTPRASVLDGRSLGTGDAPLLALAVPAGSGGGFAVGLAHAPAILDEAMEEDVVALGGIVVADRAGGVLYRGAPAQPLGPVLAPHGEAVGIVRFAGADWELRWVEPRVRLPWTGALAPVLTLLCGLAVTAAITAYLILARRRAREVSGLARSLEGANEGLRESERKYREIYENAVEGIFQTSPDGRMLSANPALARIYGYAGPAELIDGIRDVSRQLYVDPARRAEFVRLIEQEAVSGFDSQIRRRDGEVIWISESARAVRDARGRILYYEGRVEDITERKNAEAALRLAKEQSDMASRAKSEFLANMSHELRTPLNAIIGFSEIIADEMFGPAGRPEYVEYARDINESGRLLLALINDILDMAKIEAGKMELRDSVVDVGRVLQSCHRLIKPRSEAEGLALSMRLPADLPFVRAEERALKQIVVNLLSNAVKFTPEGGSVTLAAAVEPDGRLSIAVSDTGIGIAPEDLPKAMAPFGQIESSLSGKTQGTGLGLPLVQALVELHGGTFRLDSEPGRGTTARVVLPADRVIRQVA
jgi:PAS domain S-box-containing protein